ncbi:fatty-acid O-methyltransferase Mtf2 [Mycolicibacterium thermoresistibile]|uniref:Methylase n=1 Tax=Mycolicibacterium thermoresistibile TaxID=1797 RepID=A0A100XJJ5_MYCTH|nr:class I SAM-dependent methyltransferase [Mycolicibacterium thermoresistibile]MCV7186751.1 class I SAM-dependent methyltransferase [Mycolicibacterium thermoresistibile]GAT17627.1 methylase [Mycolicibacterium thermoresistibile]SNW20747.1 methylase involved in ubiquinone/menaquinone biosynthesis [Mycolicibacterium thermoresistibile]
MPLRNRVRESRDQVFRKLNEKLTQHGQKFIYSYASRRLDDDDVVFLNYGYEEDPPMGLPLSETDEPNRYSIQLYHRTAGQADLTGKRVLEVGCGHGGGASYLMRTLGPMSYVGLDLNPAGIEFCRKKHRLPGLEFVVGDAQDLPFGAESFDAVINIESSHLYPRFSRFLSEVARVLRPGGHFLYADARQPHEFAEWEAALAAAPLDMVSARVINAEVVRGMEQILPVWEDVIERVAPAFLRRRVREFAPARRAWEELRTEGSTEYRMYCFTKPPEHADIP